MCIRDSINAGLDKDLKDKGVEWLNVFAVDNVLQQIADPVFVGATKMCIRDRIYYI